MDISLLPTKPGQICKIVSDVPDMEPSEVFIVAEDPSEFDNEDVIEIVNLKELQHNIRHPENAERLRVRKDELVVISDDLTSYVQSWNDKGQ